MVSLFARTSSELAPVRGEKESEARTLWQAPNPFTLKGKRDRAMLAVLLGCGLRRRELIHLSFDHIQRREEHWVIVDLPNPDGPTIAAL